MSFMLLLEIAFLFIKANKSVEGLTVFNINFLYSVYADDTGIFLNNQYSITEVFRIFDHFLVFTELKSSKSKCEIVCILALKGVHIALCGVKCINLETDLET